jgi:hypothetical protein
VLLVGAVVDGEGTSSIDATSADRRKFVLLSTQIRIDRRAPHRRIAKCKFTVKPGQIESIIDLRIKVSAATDGAVGISFHKI